MSNSKVNILPKPLPTPLSENHSAFGVTDSALQIRAYELYELRGKIDGFAQEDWYKAESDVRGGSQKGAAGTHAPSNFNMPMKGPKTA